MVRSILKVLPATFLSRCANSKKKIFFCSIPQGLCLRLFCPFYIQPDFEVFLSKVHKNMYAIYTCKSLKSEDPLQLLQEISKKLARAVE